METRKKLVLAVLQESDYDATVEVLSSHQIFVTKLSSSGGFLKKKNVTVMIGVEEDRLPQVLEILKTCAGRRQDTMYTVAAASPDSPCASTTQAIPIPVETGGVTVFVMDLDSLEKF